MLKADHAIAPLTGSLDISISTHRKARRLALLGGLCCYHSPMNEGPFSVTNSGKPPRCWRCEAMDWERIEEVITRVSNDRPWMVLQCRECGARMEANLVDGKVQHKPLR